MTSRESEYEHRRPTRHGRHGRAGRSSVLRPPMQPLDARWERFEVTIGASAEYLRALWPELRDVTFDLGTMPTAANEDGIPRWDIDRADKRITIFYVPLERLYRWHRADDYQQRALIDGAVFRAAAEYLGKSPWELGGERFRYL